MHQSLHLLPCQQWRLFINTISFSRRRKTDKGFPRIPRPLHFQWPLSHHFSPEVLLLSRPKIKNSKKKTMIWHLYSTTTKILSRMESKSFSNQQDIITVHPPTLRFVTIAGQGDCKEIALHSQLRGYQQSKTSSSSYISWMTG